MANKLNTAFKIRYDADITLYTGDGKTVITPTRIKGFSKHVDYSKNFTPYFVATLLINIGHVRTIKANETNIICHFKLSKVKYVNDNNTLKDRDEVERSVVFDKMFIPIFEADDIKSFREMPDTTTSKAPEDVTTSGQDRNQNLFEVRVYLNTVDYHTMYKKAYNTVLRTANNGRITVDSALKYICESCGAAGYIIDMPDNIMPYTNIIVPPGIVKYCVDMLQLTYGIYLKDIISFFDFDSKLYILSKYSKTHEYEKDMPRLVNFIIQTNREQSSPGTTTYLEGDTVSHTVFKGVEDQNMSITSGEAYGDSIVFTNYEFGAETFIYKDGKLDSTNPVTREYIRNVLSHEKSGVGMSFEYDELNNPFNMFSSLTSIGVTAFYIITADGMDTDCLKPNVLYSITVKSDNEGEDNARYKDKFFPIIEYKQDFVRDNDLSTDTIFRSFETIVLANMG